MHRERGSVLVLMPAAVLVVIVLASLALDRAILFGAQRALVQVAQAAADDAVAAGVDLDAIRRGAPPVLDGRLVDRIVADAVALAGEPGTTAQWTTEGDVLVVRLERRVGLVFSPAVPGGPASQVVTATARAELRRPGS